MIGVRPALVAVVVMLAQAQSAAALTKKWRLKPGDVFDDVYEREFYAQELAPLRASNAARAQIERDIEQGTHVVNLRVVFK